MKYASIILFKKLGEFDDELTYRIPDPFESTCKVGTFVEVPLRNRLNKGVITGVQNDIPEGISEDKMRSIQQVYPQTFLTDFSVHLARFIANYYRTSMARALRLFIPAGLWKGHIEPPSKKWLRLLDPDVELRGNKQKELLDLIVQNKGVMDTKSIDFSPAIVKALIQKGAIEEFLEPIYKVSDCFPLLKSSDKILTDDQQSALDLIQSSKKPVLLHGVTGSGKTEVYLRLILDTIQKGKQAILLVPEIALTSQTVRYFEDFLGDRIALFHSKLTESQRAKEWWKVQSGYARLVIGSRSAIFAPVQNPGLVILDEEHEWTYKQESAPYYQTHRVAETLCLLTDSKLIFGSATPSAERYAKAKPLKLESRNSNHEKNLKSEIQNPKSEYIYVHLPNRILRNDLPTIQIVDLREEFKKRNFSIFSLALQNKIKERLENKEQIILFVNQRGMASAVVCRDCGYTEKCPHCEVSLKFHRYYQETGNRTQDTAGGRLVCHYCNYTKSPELLCLECRSPHIKHMGVGTQRVEEDLKRMFPGVRTVRADRDTTASGEGFSGIYHKFLNHEYDVLIGTQMIAKGLDFAKVSLIGIVLADVGLHIPDFRSSERLFQIITQVSGRCGRREKSGEVILQTYNPDHSTFKKVVSYDYTGFIEKELEIRKELNYPPFNQMIKFTVVGNDLEKLTEHIRTEQEALEDIFKINNLSVKILSAPALIPKMANRYYYHVLLRAEDPTLLFKHWKIPRGWRVDIDPIHTT